MKLVYKLCHFEALGAPRGCLRDLERTTGCILEAGVTSEVLKRTKIINFEVPFRGLSDALASPWEHHEALGPRKVSSLKALDSGSDSGLKFGHSKMWSEGFSLQSQLDFHIWPILGFWSNSGSNGLLN